MPLTGHLPRQLATLLIAMLPISELRGAIPFALGSGLSWQQAYGWAVLGNFIPVFRVEKSLWTFEIWRWCGHDRTDKDVAL